MNIDPISGKLPIRSTDLGAGGSVGQSAAAHGDVGTDQIADFSSMLGGAIADVAQQLKKAESVSIAGIKGMASTQDVVEQVMQAEQVLQASIAVRDKVVAAYLEISRMQI
jgi:flagellar hook-basal body complex protein FliE